ncbi:MAG TPA: hypothetical protein VGF61_23680 [Candidatus Acidoferrum sp.]|jgi:hypothetical protein
MKSNRLACITLHPGEFSFDTVRATSDKTLFAAAYGGKSAPDAP